VGDHVVVINTRHIAMEGDLWRTFMFHHYTGYAVHNAVRICGAEIKQTVAKMF